MAEICEFGTAPEQVNDGYKGIGVIYDTDEGALEKFFSDDVRLVKGAAISGSNKFEYFVMTK